MDFVIFALSKLISYFIGAGLYNWIEIRFMKRKDPFNWFTWTIAWFIGQLIVWCLQG